MCVMDACDLFSRERDGEVHTWEVERLWELAEDLPISDWPVSSLEHLLDEVVWFDVGDRAALMDRPTVRAVATHSERITGADLSYPVLLSSDGLLMDGMHRLARAWMEGRDTIKVKQFNPDPDPCYTEPASERA